MQPLVLADLSKGSYTSPLVFLIVAPRRCLAEDVIAEQPSNNSNRSTKEVEEKRAINK